MGRRKKAAKKVVKKKNPTVSKVFKCLFCSTDGSVSCHLDFNAMIGSLVCRVCEEKFQTTINSLSDPVDVFSEWLDETTNLQIQENNQRKVDRHSLNNVIVDNTNDVDDNDDNIIRSNRYRNNNNEIDDIDDDNNDNTLLDEFDDEDD
eukprot:gene18823-24602_t